MTRLEDARFVERQSFFPGQQLHADDLQGLEAFHREMRELHNRSLHQPGVGSGLAVSGQPGDRAVHVGPGYALDAQGHEIVVVSEQEIPVPPVASEDDGGAVYFDLTIAYPDDRNLEEAETRAGVCETHGTVRLREEPVFCWARLERRVDGTFQARDDTLRTQMESGMKIRIGRVAVLDCAIHALVVAQRRNARPPTQPRLACGRASVIWTVRDATDWAVSAVPNMLSPVVPMQLVAQVDTSEAAFLTTPHYSARLDGPRLLGGFEALIALTQRDAVAASSGGAGGSGGGGGGGGIGGSNLVVAAPYYVAMPLPQLPTLPGTFLGNIFADGMLAIDQPSTSGFQATVTVLSPVIAYVIALLSPLEAADRDVVHKVLSHVFSNAWQIEWMGTE